MILNEISVFQFRNLSDRTLVFSPKVNLFIGQNGQGKTNLVEAIHLLSTTKSFRTAKLPEVTAWEKKEGSVFGKVSDEQGLFSLGVILSKNTKSLLIDNSAAQAVKFISRFVSITFSPSDIELIKGPSALRRTFIDKHCADVFPAVIPNLLQYNRALKNKQKLLKIGTTINEISSWNSLLATHGASIYKARALFVQRLMEKSKQYHEQFATEDGELSIKLHVLGSKDAMHLSEEHLLELFQQKAGQEIEGGRTLVGPHRDDLEINYGGIDARKYGSQGQSKSLAIALKLGLIDLVREERAEAPVIVLDDVDSELDSVRLDRLYQLLLSTDAQVFITGTQVHPAVQKIAEKLQIFSVACGQIEPHHK